MNRVRLLYGLAALALVGALAGCAPAPTATPASAPAAGPTETLAPTEVPTAAATPTVAATDTPAATATPAVTPTPTVVIKTGAIGERIEAGGMALTVNKVTNVDAIGDTKPSDGATLLVLNVTIEDISHEQTPINPFDFVLVMADNSQVNPIFAAPDPVLQSNSIKAGQKVTGNVTFEIPTDAKGYVVQFQPLVFGEGYEPIRVTLGQ